MRSPPFNEPSTRPRGFAPALVVGLAIAGALVGLTVHGWNGASIAAPRATGTTAPSLQPVAQVGTDGNAPVEHSPVRERGTSPVLDKFEAHHAEAVSRVLGERRTAVVECLVLEQWPHTGMLRLLCRETDDAKGTKKGDVIEAYHNASDERWQLHIDTGVGHLQPGEVRSFLLQRRWWKTFLRIPGKVTGTLDFAAMRNACDWPTGRDCIGTAGVSVVEGRLAATEPSKRAQQRGVEEALLTIERVHWSPDGWEPAEVHRVSVFPALALDEDDVEMRLASHPPQGVALFLFVAHGWPGDILLRARVR